MSTALEATNHGESTMTIATALKSFINRIASQPEAQPNLAADTTQSAVVIPLHKGKDPHEGNGSHQAQVGTTEPADINRHEDDLDRAINQSKPHSSPAVKFHGVLDSPELKAYLSQNFFVFGRYNGARYQTKQALDTGREAVISNFINVLEQLSQKHHAKRDAIERSQHGVSTLSAELSSRLELSLRQNDRVIQLLEQQVVAARSGEGWIAAALREYESGFTRGVHDAVDFDRIDA
jgi:hypothetical protein